MENITCTADEVGNRIETSWSFEGNSGLENRFAALERRVTSVSNELDAFKASVMQTFDTFNAHLEEMRREIRDKTQSRTVITSVIFSTALYKMYTFLAFHEYHVQLHEFNLSNLNCFRRVKLKSQVMCLIVRLNV